MQNTKKILVKLMKKREIFVTNNEYFLITNDECDFYHHKKDFFRLNIRKVNLTKSIPGNNNKKIFHRR